MVTSITGSNPTPAAGNARGANEINLLLRLIAKADTPEKISALVSDRRRSDLISSNPKLHQAFNAKAAQLGLQAFEGTAAPTSLAGSATSPFNSRTLTLAFSASGKLSGASGDGVTMGGEQGKMTTVHVSNPNPTYGSRMLFVSLPLTAADGHPAFTGQRVLVSDNRIIGTIKQDGTISWLPPNQQEQVAATDPLWQAPAVATLVPAAGVTATAAVNKTGYVFDNDKAGSLVATAVSTANRSFPPEVPNRTGKVTVTLTGFREENGQRVPIWNVDVSQVGGIGATERNLLKQRIESQLNQKWSNLSQSRVMIISESLKPPLSIPTALS